MSDDDRWLNVNDPERYKSTIVNIHRNIFGPKFKTEHYVKLLRANVIFD